MLGIIYDFWLNTVFQHDAADLSVYDDALHAAAFLMSIVSVSAVVAFIVWLIGWFFGLVGSFFARWF